MTIESCNATWIFDTERRRFRRILRGVEVEGQAVSTGWRTYHHLELKEDSEIFTIALTSDGSRLIQSWRHIGECPQCRGTSGVDFSVEEIEAILSRGFGLSASSAPVG